MIVTLDIGNSHPNYCTFKNGRVIEKGLLNHKIKLSHEDYYISSKVGKLVASNFVEGGQYLAFPSFTEPSNQERQPRTISFLEMPVNYAKTLGQDRLSAAYAYYSRCLEVSSQNALIIDAGTFLTVDGVSKTQGFLGGYIFPGPKSYFKTYGAGENLARYEALPLSPDHNQKNKSPFALPQDTAQAIESSYFDSLDGLIQRLVDQYAIDLLILSGGFAPLLQEKLAAMKNQTTQTRIEPILVHLGLLKISQNILLQANREQQVTI